jgi:hypothetical protein
VAAGGGFTGICVIGGMARAGQTAFAVHAAHWLAGSFPDGQFFLPLHAHTPVSGRVEPADALASLLLTAGLAAQHLPPGTEARVARWRGLFGTYPAQRSFLASRSSGIRPHNQPRIGHCQRRWQHAFQVS